MTGFLNINSPPRRIVKKKKTYVKTQYCELLEHGGNEKSLKASRGTRSPKKKKKQQERKEGRKEGREGRKEGKALLISLF